MASKAYTLNYFIDFFSKIPDRRWTTGTLQQEGSVQKCALGHAGSDLRRSPNASVNDCNNRANALEEFLQNQTTNINDATSASRYYTLGKTPRGRILRALRNRKRYRNILGNVGSE